MLAINDAVKGQALRRSARPVTPRRLV